jgi:uncharacterized protein YbjT (DUF2867 family)
MILVTGAAGNIGRSLIDLLINKGVAIRAVILDGKTADLPSHVEVVRGDLSRPDTIAPALTGVSGLFINPRAVGNAAGELLALARERGVRRVVTLSAMNVEDNPAEQPSRYNGDKNKEVEDAVTGSGLEWVSLRSSFYAVNTVGMWSAQMKLTIFAATGGIGRCILDQAVAAGQDVTAVVRNPKKLTTNVRVVADKPLTGTYRTAYGQNLRRGLFVSRADVAHLMLHVLDQPEAIEQTISLAN